MKDPGVEFDITAIPQILLSPFTQISHLFSDLIIKNMLGFKGYLIGDMCIGKFGE